MDDATERVLDDAFDRADRALSQENLEKAAEIFREIAEIAPDPEDQAVALNNACFLLNGLGRFSDSLPACLRATELRRESGSDLLVRSLNNLAVALQGSGDAPSAIASLREALRLNRLQEDWDGAIANHTNLAINYQTLGRFAAADRESLQALELCQRYSSEEWAAARCALTRMNRATLLERLGRYPEGLELLDGVLADNQLAPATRANAELNRGVIYRNLGDPSAARDSFDQAAALFRQQGNSGGEASARLNIGLTRHRNLRDPRGALDSLERAVDLAVAAGDAELAIEARYNLGRAQLDLDLRTDAFSTFTEALVLAEKSGSGVGLWSSLAGLAAVDRREGRYGRAVETLKRALDQIERQSRNLSFQSSSSFLAERRDVYEAAIALTEQARASDGIGQPDFSSFELVQRFKARALSDALGDAPLTAAGGETRVEPGELQSHLGSATLIEYFEVEGRLLAFVVVGGSEAASPAPIDLGIVREIEESIARVDGSLQAGTDIPESDLVTLGMRLLRAPLAVRQGTTTMPEVPGQLILAPDGMLWSLPWDALVLEAATSLSGGAERLIDRTSLRLVPSANALATLSTLEQRSYDLRFEGWALDDATNATLGVDPLENAAGELRKAAEALGEPTRLLIGPDASEGELRSNPRRAMIRHFATHTRVDAQSGLTSTVLLAPGSPEVFEDDGQLTPGEISQLDMPAELTVLAACRTIGEPGSNADEALGTLSSAFLLAGSRSVLATLWDIDDRSSAALLEQFYHHLSRGSSPDHALRAAKRTLAGDPDWQDPYYWAGWVLIGDASQMRVSRSWFGAPGVLVLAALLLLIAALVPALGRLKAFPRK